MGGRWRRFAASSSHYRARQNGASIRTSLRTGKKYRTKHVLRKGLKLVQVGTLQDVAVDAITILG